MRNDAVVRGCIAPIDAIDAVECNRAKQVYQYAKYDERLCSTPKGAARQREEDNEQNDIVQAKSVAKLQPTAVLVQQSWTRNAGQSYEQRNVPTATQLGSQHEQEGRRREP